MKRITCILLFLLIGICPIMAAGYEVRIDGVSQQADAFKHYQYVSCTLTKPADFTVTSSEAIASAEVSPLSRGVKATVDGNKISFRLAETGQYVVRINDSVKLVVFAEKPAEKVAGVSILTYKGIIADGSANVTALLQKAIDECAKAKRTLIFPAGEYLCGQLRLPSHTHLHLERGAVLKADACSMTPYESNDNMKTRRFIYIKDAQDVRITGFGAIDGSGRALRDQFADKARMRLILAVNSSDLRIEGVMLRDPGSWNTQILLCRNVMISNVKLMNDTELSNTDGFDPDAVQDFVIENSFAYCSDDNVAIKTTGYSDYLGDVKNITVRGCVFLTKKSSLKVGTETRGAQMSGILFENNDVLESDRGMALYVSDGTALSDVRYLNNRFERYWPNSKQMLFHFVVDARKEGGALGSIRNVEIKDCTYNYLCPKGAGVKSQTLGGITAVRFENLVVCGEKVLLPEQIGLKTTNAEVTFE